MKLHEVSPREQDGRDTLSRYKAQTKAIGLACLEILDNNGVDRVYCDWHDDYVVRKTIDNDTLYCFVQVKTKSKQRAQWSLIELLGVNRKKLKTDSIDKVIDSFFGKLLKHTVNFGNSCEKVIFLTNIYVKEEVESLFEAIKKDDDEDKAYSKLIKYFPQLFPNSQSTDLEEIKSNISKLEVQDGADHIRIDEDNFESIAKQKIFEYSEIDLQHIEAKEILESLLSKVEKQSSGTMPTTLTANELDEATSLCIDDLLNTLSLSKIAYNNLIANGDQNALKSLSILQKILKQTDTPDEMVEFAAQCKTKWDLWYMKNRLDVPDYHMRILESKLAESIKNTIFRGELFSSLDVLVNNILLDLKDKASLKDLNEEIILGGLFSVLVRSS